MGATLRSASTVLAASCLACVGERGESGRAAPEVRDPQPVPVRGGTIVVALKSDIASWNPYTANDVTSAAILDLIYPRLVIETTGDGSDPAFRPWLADAWSFSKDREQLTFRLRADARWSDGLPVTCDDVRFTYTAQISEDLAWPGAFLKSRIEGVDCPDPATVVFRFSEPYPDQVLDANDNAIVPAAYGRIPFAEWSATAWERDARTCGPYRVASVRPGQEAILERDPAWWGSPATYPDRVIFRIFADETGQFDRFLGGEADLLVGLPPLRAAEIAEHQELRLVDLPSLSYDSIGWNTIEPDAYLEDRARRRCASDADCRESAADILRLRRERPHPALADRRVRGALTLAIDREDLRAGIWAGHARPGSSPIVSAQWAHDPRPTPSFDPAQAARLLDSAGWRLTAGAIRSRDGRPLELRAIVQAEHRVRRDVLERVAANLAAVGVRLIPEPLPRREFVARARDKNFDAILIGWSAGTRVQPQSLLHTRTAVDRGNNFVSWSTPASDDLLDRAERASTRDLAGPLWKRWQQIFHEEQPLTILYEKRELVGIRRRLQGPDPSPLNPYLGLSLWWVRPDDGERL